MGSALLPLNNGRTLPSKWEDAERWIFSPVSGDGAARSSFQQPQKRPKSKSGPLGPPGVAYFSIYSPAVPVLEGGNVGNLMVGSPFLAGVMAADCFTIQCGEGPRGSENFPARTEPCMGRSVSVHGCSELLSQSSLPGSRDAATNISRAVSRRDIATQMSPEGSPHSSPGGRPSFSSTSSILPIVEFQSVHSSKPEVRDVQVDERVTMIRWSKKQIPRIPGRFSENVDEWKRKTMDVPSVGWEIARSTNNIPEIKREEARITAWENLQKAKAEATISETRDETGKEEIVIHGEDYEQTKISREESSRHEEHSVSQSGRSSCPNIPKGHIFPKDSPDRFLEWLLYVPCVLRLLSAICCSSLNTASINSQVMTGSYKHE